MRCWPTLELLFWSKRIKEQNFILPVKYLKSKDPVKAKITSLVHPNWNNMLIITDHNTQWHTHPMEKKKISTYALLLNKQYSSNYTYLVNCSIRIIRFIWTSKKLGSIRITGFILDWYSKLSHSFKINWNLTIFLIVSIKIPQLNKVADTRFLIFFSFILKVLTLA